MKTYRIEQACYGVHNGRTKFYELILLALTDANGSVYNGAKRETHMIRRYGKIEAAAMGGVVMLGTNKTNLEFKELFDQKAKGGYHLVNTDHPLGKAGKIVTSTAILTHYIGARTPDGFEQQFVAGAMTMGNEPTKKQPPATSKSPPEIEGWGAW